MYMHQVIFIDLFSIGNGLSVKSTMMFLMLCKKVFFDGWYVGFLSKAVFFLQSAQNTCFPWQLKSINLRFMCFYKHSTMYMYHVWLFGPFEYC